MLAGVRDVLLDYDRINSLIAFSTNGNYKLSKFQYLLLFKAWGKIKTES